MKKQEFQTLLDRVNAMSWEEIERELEETHPLTVPQLVEHMRAAGRRLNQLLLNMSPEEGMRTVILSFPDTFKEELEKQEWAPEAIEQCLRNPDFYIRCLRAGFDDPASA